MDLFIPPALAHHEGTAPVQGTPSAPPPAQGDVDYFTIIGFVGVIFLVALIGWGFWSTRKK